MCPYCNLIGIYQVKCGPFPLYVRTVTSLVSTKLSVAPFRYVSVL